MSEDLRKGFARRRFLQGLGLTAGAVALTPILQACGQAPQPTPTAAPQPTAKPAAEPTKPAAAATQPAAATKPAAAATKPAAQPTAAAAAKPTQAFKGEIKFWASGYTPGVTTSSIPKPLTQFQKIADDYKKVHPDVKITFINNPITGQVELRTWLVTQFTGGTAPHISWSQPNWRNEDVEKKWWAAWDEFLEKPNPHQPGNAKWRDMFYAIPDIWRNVDGKLYTLLGDQTQVVFWYNKDIFKKAGVEEPTDWKSFMDICEKIKGSGVDPFAWYNTDLNQLTWTSGWVKNYILGDLLPKADLDKNGLVQKLEVAKAVKAGLIDYTKPEINEEIKILKDMAKYFPKGFNGANLEATRNGFFQQRTAIYMWVTGLYPVVKENPQRKFEFGAFYPVPITKATTKYANENVPLQNKGYGYGGFNYGITNTAMKDNLVEASADFIMFASVPERLGPLVAEARTHMPNVKGAAGNPDLKQFEKTLGYKIPPWEEDDVWLDVQYGEAYLKIMQPYLEGSASLETTAAALNKELAASADRVLAQAEAVKKS